MSVTATVQAVMPDMDNYPYVIRVVSEVTESNGSSSMASTCGTSLALMDAGVPIKAPVAGVAMGLIKEPDAYAVLTDILGDEDHLGDMDFKVCGTREGITALQMDIKVEGLTRKILEDALDQAKEARLHILDAMEKTIAKPRDDLSQYAPRIVTIQVKVDKIRDIIGPGGKMIRAITEQSGASINVDDHGRVSIASDNPEAIEHAKRLIEGLTAEAEIGAVYQGMVTRTTEFGAFVGGQGDRHPQGGGRGGGQGPQHRPDRRDPPLPQGRLRRRPELSPEHAGIAGAKSSAPCPCPCPCPNPSSNFSANTPTRSRPAG